MRSRDRGRWRRRCSQETPDATDGRQRGRAGSGLRGWWEGASAADDLAQLAIVGAETAELLRLGDALRELRRAARDSLTHGGEAARDRLLAAGEKVELLVDIAHLGEVRTAALYCVHQCMRVAGPIETAARVEVKTGLLEEVERAERDAHDAIRARARELDASVRGRGV